MNGRVKTTIRRPITESLPMEYELDGKRIQITVPEDVIRTIGKAFVEVEFENGDVKNGVADRTGRVSFFTSGP